MDDSSAFVYGAEKSAGGFITGILCSHLGMFVIIALYACGGAQIFVELETKAEDQRAIDKQVKATEIENMVNYYAERIYFLSDAKWNHTKESYNKTVSAELLLLENLVIDSVNNHYYDGTGKWKYEWQFLNCLLLSLSTMTTIGYGHIAPKTFEGQMFCIVFAIIGSPLYLLFLANLGNSMAAGFTLLYSRIFCRCCRSKRHWSEVPDNMSKKWMKQVMDDDVGNEEYMPTKNMFVPITINLVVLHLFFIIGAIIFQRWEDWDLISSFYFTFITLSTIGYGDYYPGNSISDQGNDEQITKITKMIIAVLYIVLGMAMLSMCINLMQEQITEKCRWLAREVGLSKNNDEVKEPKPIDKRKDSLVPIMEANQGPSPFRQTPNESILIEKNKKKKKKKAKKNDKDGFLPGVME